LARDNRSELGKILRQRRLMVRLTLAELSATAGVSPSYVGRIEKGERFPSARILRRLAKPLNFEEDELFTLADYLSPEPSLDSQNSIAWKLDPYVANRLSRETVDVQRAVVGILDLLESISLLKTITAGVVTHDRQ
jgi:transcriptional regulator with XRE-family HTH domain